MCLNTDHRWNLNPVQWNGRTEIEIKGDRTSLWVAELGGFENADLSKHDLKHQYDWKGSKIVTSTL